MFGAGMNIKTWFSKGLAAKLKVICWINWII